MCMSWERKSPMAQFETYDRTVPNRKKSLIFDESIPGSNIITFVMCLIIDVNVPGSDNITLPSTLVMSLIIDRNRPGE